MDPLIQVGHGLRTQLWMYPNGHIKSISPHEMDLKRVAKKAVSALKLEHGTTYKIGPISQIIYQVSGSSVDWVHSKLGIKYTYGLELRPDQGQKGFKGFMLPVSQIKPTVEETWAGIQGMAWEIAKEY